VRTKEEFDTLHIPEALHMELKDIEARANELEQHKLYVTVCGKGGGRSTEAARLLKVMGKESIWLCGGTFEWMAKSKA
jgi:rhodanese-related sulfurtransferase